MTLPLAESWSVAEYRFGTFPETQFKKSGLYSVSSGESKKNLLSRRGTGLDSLRVGELGRKDKTQV